MLTTVLWRLFLPINDEFLEVSNIEISEIPLGFGEILVYFLIASLVSLSFIFPFSSNKKNKPIYPYWVATSVTILAVFISLLVLDNSVKGIYLVNYLGDDFPFVYRLLGVVILLPVALFLTIKETITDLKSGWLVPFLFASILIVIFSFAEYSDLKFFSMKALRKVISEGHFLFYGTLLLGFLSYTLTHKTQTAQVESSL